MWLACIATIASALRPDKPRAMQSAFTKVLISNAAMMASACVDLPARLGLAKMATRCACRLAIWLVDGEVKLASDFDSSPGLATQ